MSKINLRTTQAQFDGLHASIAATRTTSTKVTVDKQALLHLLMDHSKFHEALKGNIQED